MEEKKSSNLIIVILICLVLVCGAGVGGYLFGKKDRTKCDVPNTKEEVKEDKDEKDGFYLVSNKYLEKFEGNTIIRLYKNETADDSELEYEFYWKDHNELTANFSVNGDKIDNIKIADNVKMFKLIYTGNAGYYSLYYLTEDGKVYCVHIDEILILDEEFVSKELDDLKDIIYFNEFRGPDACIPLFVDKDYNIVTSKKIDE